MHRKIFQSVMYGKNNTDPETVKQVWTLVHRGVAKPGGTILHIYFLEK